MEIAERLQSILAGGRTVRQLDDGIYTLIADGSEGAPYDSRAAFYDRMVGSALYNRIVWGASSDAYREFARSAVGDRDDGLFLDAGCGSMLFTADAYRGHQRPVIAVDRSLGMLRRARARLAGPDGAPPRHVLLLQGDLFDLPFLPGSFATVFCMGMLHLFDDAGPLVGSLLRLLDERGALHLTSLVLGGRYGDHSLRVIHSAGEVARPRKSDELRGMLGAIAPGRLTYRREGNMAYATISG